jgi:hypothetical protein
MNRRQLMQSLIVAAPATAVAVATETQVQSIPISPTDQFKWHEWDIRWTGWKPLPYQDAYSGQWIAKPIGEGPLVEGPYGGPKRAVYGAFSSTPGCVDWYWKGWQFNFDLQKDQILIEHDSSEAERDQQKFLALRKLIDFLRTSKVGC